LLVKPPHFSFAQHPTKGKIYSSCLSGELQKSKDAFKVLQTCSYKFIKQPIHYFLQNS